MPRHDRHRRRLLSALTLIPFAGLLRASAAAAQSVSPPIAQPVEPTKAGFLARARALRDRPSARATSPTERWSCATA